MSLLRIPSREALNATLTEPQYQEWQAFRDFVIWREQQVPEGKRHIYWWK